MSTQPQTTVVTGGRPYYGIAVGVMMMDCAFPRIRGDIGNAVTWPFPVAYRVVDGAIPERLAQAEPDAGLLEPFVDTARQLERDGVRAITTSCGFLAVHQPTLAAAVSVPVFTSSLLQVPMAAAVAGGRRVGIITAREVLTEAHFAGAGWSPDTIPVVQIAPDEDSHFVETFVRNGVVADIARIDEEIADVARRLVREHADVGAIVLECANLAPFGGTVRAVTGRPVFDLFTLGMHAYQVTVGTDFVDRCRGEGWARRG